MNSSMRSNPLVAAVLVLCGSAALCGAANSAVVSFQFTDDMNSASMVSSAASLTLTDVTDATLGSGVMFSLKATLTDPVFAAGSKISDLAFNGPTGTFNNLSGAAFAGYRGDVLIDALTYTGGDGASVSGIKFNWTDNGNAYDTGTASAFTNGKTSNWFIGGSSVGAFGAAQFLNPFAILHVNALANGSAIWLLDGAEPQNASTVAEPQMALLVATGLGLIGWTRRRSIAAIARQNVPG
ncbi:MAG: hypothetical protein ABIO45_14860 [Burkholderiaceae bacterium]